LADSPIIVLTQVPDAQIAARIARALIEKRLAACVNIGAPAESIYHWQGRIETARELPMTIKTRAALYGDVEAAIRGHHPYDTPEIVAIPIIEGNRRFLEWIDAQTRPA
jgi:periplasmic divalent cation tolerance protein